MYYNNYLNKNRPDKIVDGKNVNNFGVLFHSTKVIEDFQKRSGMEGAYTKEYQHHYIAAIARLETDGQILDVAIPLALFNYHQEVGGASVEFNLGEVGEANNETMPLAIEKFKEFQETEMFKELMDSGFTQWKLEGMHSIHAHPTGVNRFSGTDLRENIDHPGVNFPLSTGTNVANFASIIQHLEEHAEIIHTEYRIFNGVEDGERKYEKGRCLTLIKGFEDPTPEPEPVEDGAIDKIFGTSRPKPVVKKKKERKDKVLKDEFSANEAEDFAKEMMELWKACDFEPDISSVLKTNVLRGMGRLQNKRGNKTESLFEREWGSTTHTKKEKNEKKLDQDHLDKLKYLVSKDYDPDDLITWSKFEVDNTYQVEKLDDEDDSSDVPFDIMEAHLQELEKSTDGGKSVMTEFLSKQGYTAYQMRTWDLDKMMQIYEMVRESVGDYGDLVVQEEEPPTRADMINFLVGMGYKRSQLNTWNDEELSGTIIAIDEHQAEPDPKGLSDEEKIEKRKEMTDSLVNDNVYRHHILKSLTYDELEGLYIEVYGQD